MANHCSNSSLTVERTPDGPGRMGGGDHLSEGPFGVGPAATNRDRAVETAAGGRIGADVDAQLPGAGASLT